MSNASNSVAASIWAADSGWWRRWSGWLLLRNPIAFVPRVTCHHSPTATEGPIFFYENFEVKNCSKQCIHIPSTCRTTIICPSTQLQAHPPAPQHPPPALKPSPRVPRNNPAPRSDYVAPLQQLAQAVESNGPKTLSTTRGWARRAVKSAAYTTSHTNLVTARVIRVRARRVTLTVSRT